MDETHEQVDGSAEGAPLDGDLDEALTVAVAGATGFVGRHVVAALVRRGHLVRALVRDSAKASRAFAGVADASRIVPVQADSISTESASRLVDGADACVNCIGIIREEHGQRFEALHVGAVRALVAACEHNDVFERFVQISATGVSPDGRAVYQRTKYEGERVIRRSTLPWTILRPSAVLGEGGELMGMLRDWAKGSAPPFLFMPYFTRRSDGAWNVLPGETADPLVAPVQVTDLARAVADALELGETVGEVYNVCGDETVSWPELLTFVRDRTPGAKPTIRPAGIPAPPAAIAAQVASIVGLGGLLPFDAGMASMASEDAAANTDKFDAHFGFTPGSFRALFPETAGA
ncbi:MAG: NAD(P)H-binding protein [Planctomycetota bacterium]